MRYTNLAQLLKNSKSTRKYFLSLPVEVQLLLHEWNDSIHTAEKLHIRVYGAEVCQKQVAIGNFYFS